MQFMPKFLLTLMVCGLINFPEVESKILNQFSRAKQTISGARAFLSNGRHSHPPPIQTAVAASVDKPSRLARVADITSQSAVALSSLGTLFATVTGFGKPSPVVIEQVRLLSFSQSVIFIVSENCY